MAVYEVAGVGSEEHGGTHEVRGVAPAGSGGLSDDELVEGMSGHAQGRGLGGLDIAGADAVALDVVLAVLGADVAGEHLEAALGAGVGGNGLAAQFAHHGADVDDLAVAFFDHLGDDGLADDEGGVQVHVDDLAEIRRAHLAHGDAFDDARVVDQNIDDADFFLDLVGERLHGGLIGHVADIALGGDAKLGVGGKSLVDQLLIDIVEHDLRARLMERGGNGETDAVAGAGDPRDFAFQREGIQNHDYCLLNIE